MNQNGHLFYPSLSANCDKDIVMCLTYSFTELYDSSMTQK